MIPFRKEYNFAPGLPEKASLLLKLGNGFAPIQKMLDAGINVCLGTDGAASNNSLNMFHELSLLTLIHKGTVLLLK